MTSDHTEVLLFDAESERDRFRERAEAAEAKLAEIEAHCRKHAEWVSLHCPDLGRPAEALVKAADILAITGTGTQERSDEKGPDHG